MEKMNISELRKQYQMSQDDFANIFHVSRQTVSNWENGKSYPDVEMLVKISDYFGISVDQLIRQPCRCRSQRYPCRRLQRPAQKTSLRGRP